MKKLFVCLITGASGAGKTTTSLLLAKKYKKCAVIEVDILRHFIKSGHVSPFNKEDGINQLILGTKNACLLAKSFLANGFNVIIDDYVGGKKRYLIYKQAFRKYKFTTIALLPNKETTIKRDNKRTGTARMGLKRILFLHDKISKHPMKEKDWIVIDNTKHHPKKTAQKIYNYLN